MLIRVTLRCSSPLFPLGSRSSSILPRRRKAAQPTSPSTPSSRTSAGAPSLLPPSTFHLSHYPYLPFIKTLRAQNSLYSIGWSREKLSRPVLWVEEEIAKLEARRHSFWQPQQQQHPPQHSPPIPPHAPAPPTQSQFYPSEPQHPDFGSPSSSTSSPSSSFHPAHHQSMENSFAGFDFDPSSLVGGGNVGGGGAGDPFLSQPASAFGEEVGMSLNGMTGTGQLYTDEEISLILGAVTADLEAFDEGGVFDGLLG